MLPLHRWFSKNTHLSPKAGYPLGFDIPEVTSSDPQRDRVARRWVFGSVGVAMICLGSFIGIEM